MDADRVERLAYANIRSFIVWLGSQKLEEDKVTLIHDNLNCDMYVTEDSLGKETSLMQHLNEFYHNN